MSGSFKRGWWKLKRHWEEDPEFIIGVMIVSTVATGMLLQGAAKYKDARTRAKLAAVQEKSVDIYDREVARRERKLYA